MNQDNFNYGDVVLVKFDEYRNYEQNETTLPALIITCDAINKNLGTLLVCLLINDRQISESLIGAIFVPKEVIGLSDNSIVLCLQIFTISKNQIVKCIGSLPDSFISSIKKSLKTVLNLDE